MKKRIKLSWNLFILLAVCISISVCSKDEEKKAEAGTTDTPLPVSSNAYLFSTELNTRLEGAGLTNAQAEIITSGAILEAKPLVSGRITRADATDDITLIAPAIVKGAMKSIPKAGLTEALALKAINIISSSPIQSLFGRIEALTDDQKKDLIKSIVETATGNLAEAGLASADKIAEASKGISGAATIALGKAGFSTSMLGDCIEKLNFGAVSGLGSLESAISDLLANIATVIANIAQSSVSALKDIKGLTQEQIAHSSQKVTKGATEALDDAQITDENIIRSITQATTKAAISALGDTGLKASYVTNTILGIINATYNALDQAGVADKTTFLADIKTSAKEGISSIDSKKIQGLDTATANTSVDNFDPAAFTFLYENAMTTGSTFTVGGALSGASGDVVLKNNNGDDLTVTANGSFTFATTLRDTAFFSVTISTGPTGQACFVSGGAGAIAGNNVTNIQVICSAPYTVGGTVTGLAGTLILQNNSGDNLTITTDGAFTFATGITDTQAYNVSVLTQPNLQVCSISNGTGTISAANITDVTIACVDGYSVGGNVTGLAGTLVLQNNSGDDLTITANGPFTFATALSDGGGYNVSVKSQPANQQCDVLNEAGTVAGANVTGVIVNCAYTYTIGGTLSGLNSGERVVLQNNSGDDLTITADGPFTFATALSDEGGYNVFVKSQPANQQCDVLNEAGAVAGGNVTTVTVTCVNTYTVGGTLSGLNSGESVVLQNNSGDDLSLSSNGSFTFTTKIATDSSYSITVLTQPTDQYCAVSRATGSVSGANVTSVIVTCKTYYTVGGDVIGFSGSAFDISNGSDILSITGNGPFTFTVPILDGGSYFAYIWTAPEDQACKVLNPYGYIYGSNVTNIIVECKPKSPGTFTIGGDLSGLNGGTLVLFNYINEDSLSLTDDGPFTFPPPLTDGQFYYVVVSSPPADQTCYISNYFGYIFGADVLDINVVCAPTISAVY